MSLVNLAGAALVFAAGSVAPPAASATTQASSTNTEKQQTIKIRNDGNVERPPANTEDETRKAYEAFLKRVNQAYDTLPAEEDRWPNQPERDQDGRKVDQPHS
jgi:hypothetical protein